ncbi:hypothetical protein FA95DRAFT_990950 [Auriscalpium vulgare]|uniref:Uncharacterized protein n=1 Tax=Auriscalpium vulgare TaxID=40419 RepID=A0ACB8R6M9_9AGAM|nr:hypothetical protein FA95DRAFT_990950 [Auriscalpium vulgare]
MREHGGRINKRRSLSGCHRPQDKVGLWQTHAHFSTQSQSSEASVLSSDRLPAHPHPPAQSSLTASSARQSLSSLYTNNTCLSPASIVDALGSAGLHSDTNPESPPLSVHLATMALCRRDDSNPGSAACAIYWTGFGKHLARPLPSMRLSSWLSLPSSSCHLSIPSPSRSSSTHLPHLPLLLSRSIPSNSDEPALYTVSGESAAFRTPSDTRNS